MTILITGSSRGIGAATAIAAARAGYEVCINYRKNEKAALEVKLRVEELGAKCIAVQADVSEEREVISLFETIDQELGPLTALVNNAGGLDRQATIFDLTAERINHILRHNVTSTFLCCREAAKRMAKSRGGAGGAIVNVSSVAAKTGAPGEYTDYAASKGAIDTFTLGIAKELAPEGIRVNTVRPGFIYTDIHADGGEPGRVDRIKSTLPMQRGGKPEEVAEAIIWLLSHKASYTTGSFLELSGGRV
ncbi:MAG: SDR family oxidoreductase [Chitinophagaceae bacterium]|nr:SDR family oxidoreductase [Chitinophagaceae bacterium]